MSQQSLSQNEIWKSKGADEWYLRNADKLKDLNRHDWCRQLLSQLDETKKRGITRIFDLGCADGWRLQSLRTLFPQAELTGMDLSPKALEAGKQMYPDIQFVQGDLAKGCLEGKADLVIVANILNTIDRELLSSAIARVDQYIADNGLLLLMDFYPDYPGRRIYSHLGKEGGYIHKQNYARVFKSLNTFREIAEVYFSCTDMESPFLKNTQGDLRLHCCLMQKSLSRYYAELT